MESYLQQLLRGEPLREIEVKHIIGQIKSGQVSDTWIAGFISLLASKGETPLEIGYLAKAIKTSMPPLTLPADLQPVDLVGTGGDSSHSLNISTAASLVVASCGIPVAKHGNRSVSSKCGSADLLEAWGIPFQYSPSETLSAPIKSLRECGLAFLYAPIYNPVMCRLGPVRRCLKIRSCFNIMGPLLNPMGVKTLLIGVYEPRLLETMAMVLQELGVERAVVVHSAGMDEATSVGETEYCEVLGGEKYIGRGTIHPTEIGLSLGQKKHLQGGTIEYNAHVLEHVFLSNKDNPDLDLDTSRIHTIRETLALNAGIMLYLSGKAKDIQTGCQISLEAIRSGDVHRKLEQWRAQST